ncbi:hypothetical protein MTO96_046359, partial [Rhipicephalus appendiculatus]
MTRLVLNQPPEAELKKINTLIRNLVKASLGIPNSASNEKLVSLGVHNTMEEMAEAQQMAQQERQMTTRAGRLILNAIGTVLNRSRNLQEAEVGQQAALVDAAWVEGKEAYTAVVVDSQGEVRDALTIL